MRCQLAFLFVGVVASQHQYTSGGDHDYSECEEYLGSGPGEGERPPPEGDERPPSDEGGLGARPEG
eukprot:CAMPEP_0194504050 /NCGR_PEP_ID=MMETSP0253-20130528/28726_1 /TAXON_ID=2966 /ORGANISM="Noctiluca scintillans" /LENGTH=65 /DNA_ID=CAMNT_0039346395 /DNA_START=69 /DNA_END=263 /DNA_ORIENTATION=-